MSEETKDHEGLYKKFEVSRSDGEELPPNATFLVLRLDEHGDHEETMAARSAAKFYARQVNNPTMLKDLATKYPPNSSNLPYRMISAKELVEAHQLVQFGGAGWARPIDVMAVARGASRLDPSVVIALKCGRDLTERFHTSLDADIATETYGKLVAQAMNVRGDT